MTRGRRALARTALAALLLGLLAAPGLAQPGAPPAEAAAAATQAARPRAAPADADEAARPQAAPADADEAARPRAARPQTDAPRGRRRGSRTEDYETAVLRLGLLVAGLVVYAVGLRWPRRLRALRVGVLLALGATAYASYYFFFQFYKPGGLDGEDVYLYYLGSKYAPEVGYFGLYECTIAALIEAERIEPDEVERIRDLRTLRMIDGRRAWARGKRCKRDDFTPERWREFRADVTWFRNRMNRAQFAHLMGDHGYQPGPVWSTVARPISSAFPTSNGGPIVLSRIDRVLIVVGFGVVAWGFGLETAALVALVWGTGFLWRFGWIGDSFLRTAWLVSALAGLSLARRGRDAAAGAALALSALMRVFPAVFVAGYGLHALRRTVETRRVPGPVWRFALGAAIATALLVGASFQVTGRGPAIWSEFALKVGQFSDSPAMNRVGLPVLVHAALSPVGLLQEGDRVPPTPDWLTTTSRVLSLGLGLAMIALLWRAMRHAEAWEGAAMGWVVVPLLTQPTNYYYTFTLAALLLASRRPRIGVWLLGAAVAWIAGGLFYYGRTEEFVLASAVAVGLCFAVVLEMARPAPDPAAPARPAADPAAPARPAPDPADPARPAPDPADPADA